MSTYQVRILSGHSPEIAPFKAMIYSDFLKSLRHGNTWFKLIESDKYFDTYKQLINALLSRPASEVRLACLSDSPDTCLGWSLSEGKTLHYVFVKKDYREIGVGSELVPASISEVSHITKIGEAIMKRSRRHLTFNPFF